MSSKQYFKSIWIAILVIMLVAVVLLISDISNRRSPERDQKEMLSIALVHWNDVPYQEQLEQGIEDRFRDHGWLPGEHYKIRVYKAGSDIGLLNSIFNQISNSDYDLIFTSSTPALQTALQFIHNTPVVFTAVADPILAGAGLNADNHVGNVTGVSIDCAFNTMCELIARNAPGIKTLGTVYCPSEIISLKFRDEFTRTAAEYGMEVKFFPANTISDLPEAITSMMHSRIDAVCQMGDNLLASGISTLLQQVRNSDLPYFDFNPQPEGTKMESLILIDVDYYQNGYDAGAQAVDILSGKRIPAEIPFQKPSKDYITLNPEKAAGFGIRFDEQTRSMATVIVGEEKQEKQVN